MQEKGAAEGADVTGGFLLYTTRRLPNPIRVWPLELHASVHQRDQTHEKPISTSDL